LSHAFHPTEEYITTQNLDLLGGGFFNIVLFSSLLGEDEPIFEEHIFQMGWKPPTSTGWLIGILILAFYTPYITG